MLFLINALGWIGSICILVAYWFNSQGRMAANSLAYQMLNLFGGLFLAFNCFYFQAYPSAALNVAWIFIALAALGRLYKLKIKGNPPV